MPNDIDKPDGEQRVESAEQTALDEDIDPIHLSPPYNPK